MFICKLISHFMKKRIYLILLSVTVIFFSCKDNSDFKEQLFTTSETSIALRHCLDSVVYYTCDTLCVVDTVNHEIGFFYHDKLSYRIELPAAANNVVDTLLQYSSGNPTDSSMIINAKNSLIYYINRAAEQCGKDKDNNIMIIHQFWKPTSDSMKFSNPYAILRGGDSALTNFVKQKYQAEFIEVLVESMLYKQFNDLHIITNWNALQKDYFDKTGIYISIDILNPAAQQMAAGFFRKMGIIEKTIRKDPARWGSPNGLFYRVFDEL
jgi:hypothetical protein